MSKSIEVDEEVYTTLCRLIEDFDDTPNMVLRRLLSLTSESPQPEVANAAQLIAFVKSPKLKSLESVTDRYLIILGFIHDLRPNEFPDVLDISGRERRYFGKSKREIESSGLSTFPKQIPGTKFWAMTNSDNQAKQSIMKKVLNRLSFSSSEIKACLDALEAAK